MFVAAVLVACRSPEAPEPPRPAGPTATSPPAPAPAPTSPCAGVLQINEAVSSNVSGAIDENGDHRDWVEVVGLGPAVTVTGLTLFASGETWPLPALVLEPGVPVLVWPDVSLDASGVSLAVVDATGCPLDALTLPRMYADESYGRDLAGALGYFLEPTPGAPNTTESHPGFSPPPVFLTPAGFGVTDVVLEVPAGVDAATYTRDGAVPLLDSLPAGPISVADSPQPVVLRARTFTDGLWPSRIATATYGPDAAPAGMRILSLAVDPPDLWDELTGIYVFGPNAEPVYPYFGANFWQPWERDVHVEIWDASGALVVSQDAGIEIAGGYSRAFDQRNFELVARGGYGPDDFAAALFDQEQITSFERLYLRNGGDWCGTQLVDATVEALFRDATGARLASADAQATEPALVYLNGEFWGLYELKERLDVTWSAAHRGADPAEQDFAKLGWTHDANWSLEAGDWDAWNALEVSAEADLSDPTAWADFESRVDLVNFSTALVAQGWIANSDWWTNNIRMWRERPDGAFRWMVYDFGHGWADWNTDHLATTVGTSLPGMRVADALENEAFRVVLVNTHAELLATTLAGPNAQATVTRLADEVRPVMGAQRARWCGGPDLTVFEASVDYASQFAANRAPVMSQGVADWLAPGGPAALSLDVLPAGAGRFSLTVVSVEGPFTGTFYRDTPVTVTAVPEPGYTFAGWSDAGLGAGATALVPMEGDTAIVAYFEPL